ncbi:Atypical/ABC1/ABC1-A protein kinase [Cryptococcus bacillisporus CA1873]|uniref:Atypical/ABC1/ABC1-A protein kinase n=1 Tax=Cryptococcus bacillisporus CA1873 TaxID=1296111 RepID=A0ABR5BAE3_CRYGA|nr:Atypical/ABC1/ABC1-A protein kinase [Cryptococcus bacillisporus CA1873]|eukprot:KIR60187.1 Atypical/ABC1/ABC1-A protein kinase [Cryptococcus gattii CA1873]
MLSAALRVLARSAAIQLEEAATATTVTVTARTATATATPTPTPTPTPSEQHGQWPTKTLDAPPVSHEAALDRLIEAAPHQPPPPAPPTHPADKSQLTETIKPVDTTPSQPIPSMVKELEAAGADPLTPVDEETPVILRASRVPASRLGRLFHYGSLAASLSIGAASESIRRSTTGGNSGSTSVFMSDANIRRLVSTLGRMRGAALKLGQFMSIQGPSLPPLHPPLHNNNHMLPPEIEQVLHQVQAHANYMPDWQMDKVLREELGADWETSLFAQFERTPIASASIGQVHRATLKTTGQRVAVKIQFPGVASSIESDLSNLSLLLRTSALLPKGLYLQNTIAVMRRELEDECDYIREAAAGKKFAQLLAGDPFFVVPRVVDEATTGKVLTTEWMDGKPLSRIGTNILRLCLRELFQFRFMQTDPNWANFLFSPPPSSSSSPHIQLIDFGASREYTKEFMDGWYRLLNSALEGDRERMRVESLHLGYLTGEENDEMIQAHLDSMALVASPFSHQGPYPFAKQTITDSVRALIPIMLKHRLTPPPQETYSLNRKLSGAFLMCAKMQANVDCKKLWEEEVGGYKEG